MKHSFSQDKRSHYEDCRLIRETVNNLDENKINELRQCRTEKLDHAMPLRDHFLGELIR